MAFMFVEDENETPHKQFSGIYHTPTKYQFPATARDCFSVIAPLPLRRVLSTSNGLIL